MSEIRNLVETSNFIYAPLGGWPDVSFILKTIGMACKRVQLNIPCVF